MYQMYLGLLKPKSVGVWINSLGLLFWNDSTISHIHSQSSKKYEGLKKVSYTLWILQL